MGAEWIDQAQARCDALPDEEWRAEVRGTPSDGPTHIAVVADDGNVVTDFDYSQYGDAAAEFTAHARTDLPRALAALRAALGVNTGDVRRRFGNDVEAGMVMALDQVRAAIEEALS